jgi:chemotaxis protein methyltransferase CheR
MMESSDASHQIIADLLSAHTGQQLTASRRWRVKTALAGVFRERGISNVDQLACLLASPGESELTREVVEALLNNETYFFRDRPTFDQLPEDIFPLLAQRRADRRKLRIWCAGCSTGQEVHSLAILFAENARKWDGWTIEILGTDISQKTVDAARSNSYSQFEVQRGLSVSQMLKHFDETNAGWNFLSNTPCAVQFRQHNVLDTPPDHSKFDLILCRNVLLYFNNETRRRAFERLHSALTYDGYLMLGAGESVVGHTPIFAPSGERPSLYEPVSADAASGYRLAG